MLLSFPGANQTKFMPSTGCKKILTQMIILSYKLERAIAQGHPIYDENILEEFILAFKMHLENIHKYVKKDKVRRQQHIDTLAVYRMWIELRGKYTQYWNECVILNNQANAHNNLGDRVNEVYDQVLAQIKSLQKAARDLNCNQEAKKHIRLIKKMFKTEQLAHQCQTLFQRHNYSPIDFDDPIQCDATKLRVRELLEKVKDYRGQPLKIPNLYDSTDRDLQLELSVDLDKALINLLSYCNIFEQATNEEVLPNSHAKFLALLNPNHLAYTWIPLSRYHAQRAELLSTQQDWQGAWHALDMALKLTHNRQSGQELYYFESVNIIPKRMTSLFVNLNNRIRKLHDTLDFAELHLMYKICNAILRALPSKIPPSNDIYQTYEEAQSLVRKKQSMHWKSIKKLVSDSETFQPGAKVLKKGPCISIPCEHIDDTLFVNILKKQYAKSMRPLLSKAKHQYPFKVKLNAADRRIYIQNIQDCPLSFIQCFGKVLIDSCAQYQHKLDIAQQEVSTKLAEQLASLRISQENALAAPEYDTSRSKPTTGYHYQLQQQSLKQERKNRTSTISSVNEVTLASKLRLTPIQRFSEACRGLDIIPLRMLSCHHSNVFVAMLPNRIKKDECSPNIRQDFELLFTDPKQARKFNAQGFKYRKVNGLNVLVAKILSNEGGNFRAIPIFKLHGCDGSVLYLYDNITKKDGPIESKYQLNTAQFHELEHHQAFKQLSLSWKQDKCLNRLG